MAVGNEIVSSFEIGWMTEMIWKDFVSCCVALPLKMRS